MRILQVRFANLNSLYGVWKIDFTNEAYVRDGLFAIIGPTGAGKSTILDAICLALYGRTPRLAAIGLQSNEIMSRQRAECFAEVTFETRKGTFRCNWEQHRAHKRVDGKLVEASHEIADVGNNRILFTKKRDVAQAVEDVTGMNFDRFTRSMLLAQGQFAAFLNAESDQRSPILEQITGTKIYSEISMRVHERTAQERVSLQGLVQEVELSRPLTDAEREGLRLRHSLQSAWLSTVERRRTALEVARNTLLAFAENSSLLARLDRQGTALESEGEQLAHKRALLADALKAMEVDPMYATVHQIRTTLVAHEEDAIRLHQASENVALELQRTQSDQARTAAAVEQALTEQRESAPTLVQARTLDERLRGEHAEADHLRRSLADAIRQRRSDLSLLQSSSERLTRLRTAMQATRDWIQAHEADRFLDEALPPLREAVGVVVAAAREVSQQRELLDEHERRASTLAALRSSVVDELQGKEDTREHVAQELSAIGTEMENLLAGKLVREYEQEVKTLGEKRILLARIASLEEHRKHLVEGQSCPLCGSLQHPFADDSRIPQGDSIEHRLSIIEQLLDRYGQLQAVRQEATSRHARLDAEIAGKRALVQSYDSQAASVADETATLMAKLRECESSHRSLHAQALSGLTRWHIEMVPGTAIESLLQDLEQRQRRYAETQKKSDADEKALQDELHEQAKCHLALSRTHKQVETLRMSLQAMLDRIEGHRQYRIRLLGDQDPDEVQRRLVMRVDGAREDAAQAGRAYLSATKEFDKLASSLDALEKLMTTTKKSLATQQARFSDQLSLHGFASEEAFIAARMEWETRKSYAQEIEDHDRRMRIHRQHVVDAESEQVRLKSLVPVGWTAESLGDALAFTEDERNTILQGLGVIEERIRQDELQREQHDSRLQRVAAQRNTLARWERLNMLIGSHDGKKFRNFAQSLTFELLINHANMHLKELSDRYLLTVDAAKPLEFSVMDLYQAGETRSARNLSGGESFLVSLSLSLGLSTMASKNVQVDSLFLDEGFGTLDEQTLETALAALSSLRNKGKLIGIISHVGALQERIPAQITVTPLSGGMSRIDGPGCSRTA